MLKRIPLPELVVGLVAPVGADLSALKRTLSEQFAAKGYKPVIIKVSDAFPVLYKQIGGRSPLTATNYYDRISSYIAFGNELRERFKRKEILAAAAIFEIARTRRDAFKRQSSNEHETYESKVYIIDQLKRPEEIDLLRNVYGPLFFQMSLYARRETRAHHISSRIAKDLFHREGSTPDSLSLELIARDENEASVPNGQRVARTFHTADFIINAEALRHSVTEQVHRFVELLFGSNSLSPTKEEYGMHAARAAALRSLDLSRQVGAAIFTRAGEVVSMGSNEVPKGLGGTYWSDDSSFDAREYTRDGDTNEEQKGTVAREFFDLAMAFAGAESDFDNFAESDAAQESRLMAALEYGRIVHAEMSALMDAARRGTAVKDAVLFTTTFPCHLCARHIVASGVSRVVYLEPYPKSLVELHADSIEVDGADRGKYSQYPAVKFEHFYGVTPRRYRELFERRKRKTTAGVFRSYIEDPCQPVVTIYRPSFAQLEQDVIREGVGQLSQLVRVHQIGEQRATA